MTKTIAFVNLKGGTGKTTLCINIAGYLAKKQDKSKILVVDFDPQANATSGLGIEGKTLEKSIYDAVLRQCQCNLGASITQIILETDVKNLHLAPSELDLAAASFSMQNAKNRVEILSRVLEPIKKFYEYILIDSPSDTGLFILNSLRAADRLVVPIDSSIFSLESLENLKIYCRDIEEMSGHYIEQFTIVLNKYKKSGSKGKKSSKPGASEEIESTVKAMSHTFFVVPDSLLVYRAQQKGLPVSHYAPNTALGKAYGEIANYLME